MCNAIVSGLSIFVMLALAATVGATQDILLVRDATKAVFYDRYQQQLSAKELRQLVSGTALILEDNAGYLGDGITPAAKVLYRGSVLYILTNEQRQTPAGLERLARCTLVGDTIRSRSAGGVQVQCASGSGRSLRPGDRAVRVFTNSGRTYGAVLNEKTEPDCFGWLVLGAPGTFEKQIAGTQMALAPDTAIVERLQIVLDRANETYQEFFTTFNNLTNQSRSVPRWETQVQPTRVRCHLAGASGIGVQLEASTRELIREIERVFADRAVSVALDNGDIVVSAGQAQ